MKLYRLVVLFILLACLVVSSPAMALPAVPLVPIFDLIQDPLIIIPGIKLLDPCFGADAVLDIVNISAGYDATSSAPGSTTPFYASIYKYDLSSSGTVVASVSSTYKRVGSGASALVTLDDTIIVPNDVTIFGRSVNRGSTGIFDLQGLFLGGLNFNGTVNNDVKGRYITTNFGGSDRFCVFVD